MDIKEELEVLKRNVDIIVPPLSLDEKVHERYRTNTPLRVKLGFDPTAPDLHLGHAVVLRKLKEFQEFGHKIVIIIGDFTAGIGDPTGRNLTRPPLSNDLIISNAKTYLDQLSKFIDVNNAEIHFNSEWFDKMSMKEIVQLLSRVTLSQILQREDFCTRFQNNVPISFHELVYPIMQGYDSVMVESDVELGGTDQLFNCLIGRDMQSAFMKSPQAVLCVPLLRGLDGQKKMSKSLKNYVGLNDEACEMYEKIMSIPDSVIDEYARLASSLSNEEIHEIEVNLCDESVNPMDIKKKLAHNIVAQFHGRELAERASEHFYKQVQSRDEEVIEFLPISLEQLGLAFSGLRLITLCSGLQPDKAKGELRRLIQGGGVTINSKKIVDPQIVIDTIGTDNFKIKLGKRNYFLVTLR
jgi:tyrosyl-tRNA synthetase